MGRATHVTDHALRVAFARMTVTRVYTRSAENVATSKHARPVLRTPPCLITIANA